MVFGTVVFAMFAGFYFWWPKMTGRMLDERLGKVHFWMLFIGFHTTFLIQHWLGVEGMPRRYADYLPEDGFTWENQVSTVGAFLLGRPPCRSSGTSTTTWRKAPMVTVDDPWGYGALAGVGHVLPAAAAQLHLAAADPLRAPAFDLHHPEVAAMEHPDLYPKPALAAQTTTQIADEGTSK